MESITVVVGRSTGPVLGPSMRTEKGKESELGTSKSYVCLRLVKNGEVR